MSTSTTPEVTWAQRSSESDPEKNLIYLTIVAPDVPLKKSKVDLQPGYIEFAGHSETKKTTYHVRIDFFDEIDVENSKKQHSDRDVAFILRKKAQKADYWPRLTKDKSRLHFLKTDFDKWVDEDEQDAVDDEAMMGGLGGMGGMGGMGADGGFGGIDFSKLGGGGMPGMGEDDEEGGEDDEDMPDLEDEQDAAAGSSKPKIEEL